MTNQLDPIKGIYNTLRSLNDPQESKDILDGAIARLKSTYYGDEQILGKIRAEVRRISEMPAFQNEEAISRLNQIDSIASSMLHALGRDNLSELPKEILYDNIMQYIPNPVNLLKSNRKIFYKYFDHNLRSQLNSRPFRGPFDRFMAFLSNSETNVKAVCNLNLSGNREMTSDQIRALIQLFPNLLNVNLSGTGISDLSSLPPCLSTLKVGACSNLPRELSLSHLTSLRKLDLPGLTRVIKIEGLETLTNLRELNLSICRGLRPTIMEQISHLNALEKLVLSALSIQLEDDDLEIIASLGNLEDLNLSQCLIRGNLTFLASLSNLQRLNLADCKRILEDIDSDHDDDSGAESVSDEDSDIESVDSDEESTSASLSGDEQEESYPMGGSDLTFLSGVPNLRELFLDGWSIDNRSLEIIRRSHPEIIVHTRVIDAARSASSTQSRLDTIPE